MRARSRPLLPYLLVGMAAVVVHAGSLDGEFLQWDDEWLVQNNEKIREGGFGDLVEILTPGEERFVYGEEYLPVRDLSWRVDRLFFEMNPVGYHLGNVLLFGVAAAALFGVLRTLTGEVRAAAIGALIFACHPVATESAACIAHRKDVLMAAFVLVAWLAWLKDRRVLAVALFVGAVLSKLPAISFPVLALLGDLALGKRLDRGRLAWLGGLGAAALAAVVVGSNVAPAIGRPMWHGGSPWTNALSVGVAFLEGIRLLLVPVGLHVGRVNETMTRTSSDLASVAGLALLVGLAILGVVALLRTRRENPGMWPVVALSTLGLLAVQAPYLQVRPFWILFAERYLVLALVPLALVAGTLLSRLPVLAGTAAAGLVVVLLAIGTVLREADWHDTGRLFSDAIEKEPRSYLALEKVAGMRFGEAQGELSRLGEIRVRMEQAAAGSARAASRRRLDEARRLRMEAERLQAIGQARVDAARSRFRESLVLAERAIEAAEALRDRGQAKLLEIINKGHWNRYNALMALERYDDAVAALDEYEADWPEEWRIPFFRGGVDHRRATEVHGQWLTALQAGRSEEAERLLAARNDLLRAAEKDYLVALVRAKDAGAEAAVIHHNLGLAYRLLDGSTIDRALDQLEKAVARDADLVVAWDELARTLAQAGRLEEVLRAWGPRWLEVLSEILAHLGREAEASEFRERARRLR